MRMSYHGPPTNPRHIKALEYLIKSGSVFLCYFGFKEFYLDIPALALLILVVCLCWVVLKHIFSPKPRKFITNEEYNKEATEFTTSEIQKLKKYCHSSKIMSKLKNQLAHPIR